ncbi:ABC-type transport auxiliary lipoprotein family protein [Paraurantiacibacter namhicola]|uniref:ABC-type transport auxiliary lipoprotein component domain-containing protein n=1 Tax=Paraurantiacibacter namhicola TaxID=645517 RepID=A0A1C7DAV9_9SPHN|nr:ABC-type transport auxiliary lipoprotein family protein [Paraurantiacibacter namhicola]ANU08629.1 hypothetical protein A6F65_02346 [Paraurantiacibacter namhicola]
MAHPIRFPAIRGAAMALALLGLSGCISFGEDPPESLLTLTPDRLAAEGTGSQGDLQNALSVVPFDTPQRLNVTRVPVYVTDSSLAYLQDAIWVEKPARLFQRLISETIRSKGTRMIVDGDLGYTAGTKLSGTLSEMGYDADTGTVTVRFDATLRAQDGTVTTRRFEASETGIAPLAGPVGDALNRAANKVADEVAEWVG